MQLQQHEIDKLGALPPRSADMTELLAAVFTRLCLRDPGGRWGIGTWWSDPVPERPWLDHDHGTSRLLWGSGDQWTLEWWGYPYEHDLIQALTDRVAGNGRCRLVASDGHHELRLGTAVLRLKQHIDQGLLAG